MAQLNRMWLALYGFPSPVNQHPGDSLPLQVEPPARIGAALAAAAVASNAARRKKKTDAALNRDNINENEKDDDEDDDDDDAAKLMNRLDAVLTNKLRDFFTEDLDLYMRILRYEVCLGLCCSLFGCF